MRNYLFKIIFITLIIILSGECSVFISPGARLGFSIANANAQDDDGNDPFFENQMIKEDRFGIRADIFVEFGLLPWISAVPGFGYVNRGYTPGVERFSSVTGDEKWKITVKNDYIVLPVLVKFKPSSWKVRPFTAIGPEMGILIKSEAEWPGTTYNVEDSYNTIDFGLDFCFGVEMSFGGIVPMLHLQYYKGLTNTAQSNVTITNATATITAGIRYELP